MVSKDSSPNIFPKYMMAAWMRAISSDEMHEGGAPSQTSAGLEVAAGCQNGSGDPQAEVWGGYRSKGFFPLGGSSPCIVSSDRITPHL